MVPPDPAADEVDEFIEVIAIGHGALLRR